LKLWAKFQSGGGYNGIWRNYVMELTLIAVSIIACIIAGDRKKRREMKERHERCRRLTYGPFHSQKSNVIDIRELAGRAALLRPGFYGDQN
jgi:heme exporter protein D